MHTINFCVKNALCDFSLVYVLAHSVQYKEWLEAHDQVRAHQEDITYGADEISFVGNPSTDPGRLFRADSCKLTDGTFHFSFWAMVLDEEDICRKSISRQSKVGCT
jgi:hypothetical protein